MLSLSLMRTSSKAIVYATAVALACAQPSPEDAERARGGIEDRAEALPDSIADIVQARVPAAEAGQPGWTYQQSASVDLDEDGQDETVWLISDVALDDGGAPLWEDGHRWQVYVKEQDGTVTRLYARFLPNGKLTAEIGVQPGGDDRTVVVLEQTPQHLGVYEFRYRGPSRTQVYRRLDRDIDAGRSLTGAARP